jgi:hypothetical protein
VLTTRDLAAQAAQTDAITVTTIKKQTTHWRNYLLFLRDVELAADPFLTNLEPWVQHRILGAFAAAYRAGRFSPTHNPADGAAVGSKTVRAAIDAVAATFRANYHSSPIHDPITTRLVFILQRQLKGYTNQDPAEKPQKAITPRILRALIAVRTTTLDEAISQLAVGAFFFAMRSCEYSKVSKSTERRTKLLVICNIRFFRRRRERPHSDPTLHLADSVSITFEFQKNDERDATITMHRTGDATLCPVISWSSIVRRIHAIPGTSNSSPVCTYLRADGTPGLVTSKQILDRIRDRVTAIGKDVLGFEAWEVGTHSIRSAAAMAMYLAGVPVYTIMLIGRWSSDAFLRYIRRQVQEFSAGVSSRMILSEDFFTIPESAHREDPRNRNQRHNFSERSHIGLDAQRLSTQPTFALWH